MYMYHLNITHHKIALTRPNIAYFIYIYARMEERFSALLYYTQHIYINIHVRSTSDSIFGHSPLYNFVDT